MTLATAFCLIAVVAALGLWAVLEGSDPAQPDRNFWHVLKYGRPGTSPKTRRQELLEARARIRRQMQILQTPMASRAPPPREEAMGELQRVLEGIEEELHADGWRKG
jgi:hypothetical protein